MKRNTYENNKGTKRKKIVGSADKLLKQVKMDFLYKVNCQIEHSVN